MQHPVYCVTSCVLCDTPLWIVWHLVYYVTPLSTFCCRWSLPWLETRTVYRTLLIQTSWGSCCSRYTLCRQVRIGTMTSFGYNYQNAFRCNLCNADLCHARVILHKRTNTEYNSLPQSILVVVAKWRHHANVLLAQIFVATLSPDNLSIRTFEPHHVIHTAAVRTCAKFQIVIVNESEDRDSYLVSVPNFRNKY